MISYEFNKPRCCLSLTDGNRASLERSASGGAFAVLARAVLSQGGVVYGAAMEGDGNVRHDRVIAIRDLPRLQGSKYVWSQVGECYDACLEDLRNNRLVLFTGVPCQIAALRLRVERSDLKSGQRNRLLTCDLICHGTPKPQLFQAYLAWLAETLDADDGIHGYQFRSKEYGWGPYCNSYYYFRNGRRIEVYGAAGDDPYYYAFCRGVTYRECCYSCRYAKPERVGDFTIGDYWGVRQIQPKAYRHEGVSAVLVNTKKASDFFYAYAARECEYAETSFSAISARQANLQSPTKRSDSDIALAREVDLALRRGDTHRIFEELLTIDQSRLARFRRMLPTPLIKVLYRLKV